MEILTLNDYELINCNCCPLPSCEQPRLSCESITTAVRSEGHLDPFATTWINYKKYVVAIDIVISYSDDDVVDSGSAYEAYLYQYDIDYTANVGPIGCLTFAPTVSSWCETNGSRTTTYYVDGVAEDRQTTERVLLSADACLWKDVVTVSDLNEDPPVDDVVDEYFNIQITTMYPSYTSGDSTVTFPETYSLGKTFNEWKTDTITTLSEYMDFETLSCIEDDCSSMYSGPLSGEPGYSVDITFRKARYRFGVPTEFLALSSARSYYELQWDEVFFPEAWDDWNDGGRIGTEPTPTPSLIESRSWLWDGDKENGWSDYYDFVIPDEPGVIRNVNLMVKCWNSTRIGTKPTAYGEVYNV